MKSIVVAFLAFLLAASPALAADLVIEDIEKGEGRAAQSGDRVAVHYTGWLLDGKKFDSSRDRNQEFVFQLGARQVIRGWDEGVKGMQVGGKRRLTIPPEAYAKVASNLHPGSAFMLTDLPAHPDTRTGTDFVIMRDRRKS